MAFKGYSQSGAECYHHGFLALNKTADKLDEAGTVKTATRRYNFFHFDKESWLKTSEVLKILNNGSKNWKQDCYILQMLTQTMYKVFKFADFETRFPGLIAVIGDDKLFEEEDTRDILSGRNRTPKTKKRRIS